MNDGFIAHVQRNADGTWRFHLLKDYLNATATLAREFASAFGSGTSGNKSILSNNPKVHV